MQKIKDFGWLNGGVILKFRQHTSILIKMSGIAFPLIFTIYPHRADVSGIQELSREKNLSVTDVFISSGLGASPLEIR